MFFEIYKKGKSIFKKSQIYKARWISNHIDSGLKIGLIFQLTFIFKIFTMIRINRAVCLVFLISKSPAMTMKYSQENEKCSKGIRLSKIKSAKEFETINFNKYLFFI